MIQNVMKHLGGIEGYGITSVCLFFTVFVTAMIWALSRKKAFLDSMSVLPLDNEGRQGVAKGESRHE